MTTEKLHRDKFLTKLIGECWHEPLTSQPYHDFTTIWRCGCGMYSQPQPNGFNANREIKFIQSNDFSTFKGFFKLWNFMKTHYEWNNFFTMAYVGVWCPCGDSCCNTQYINIDLIEPDAFANKVYDYFTEVI